MLPILRFIGLLNAAVWIGAAVFFTVAAGPAFFSEDMARILPKAHAGAAAQIVLKRYFVFHMVCAVIALLHLIVEWLYSGRPLSQISVGLVASMLLLSVAGGRWLMPRMEQLHATMYSPRSEPSVAAAARRTFGMWHGISQMGNLLMLGGLLVHLWKSGKDPNAIRQRI